MRVAAAALSHLGRRSRVVGTEAAQGVNILCFSDTATRAQHRSEIEAVTTTAMPELCRELLLVTCAGSARRSGALSVIFRHLDCLRLRGFAGGDET